MATFSSIWTIGSYGSVGSGHDDVPGSSIRSPPNILSIPLASGISILFVIFSKGTLCIDAITLRAFAVFPDDDSIIVISSPFLSLFLAPSKIPKCCSIFYRTKWVKKFTFCPYFYMF